MRLPNTFHLIPNWTILNQLIKGISKKILKLGNFLPHFLTPKLEIPHLKKNTCLILFDPLQTVQTMQTTTNCTYLSLFALICKVCTACTRHCENSYYF